MEVKIIDIDCYPMVHTPRIVTRGQRAYFVARPQVLVYDKVEWAIDERGNPLSLGETIRTTDLLRNLSFTWEASCKGKPVANADISIESDPWIASIDTSNYSGDITVVVTTKPGVNEVVYIQDIAIVPDPATITLWRKYILRSDKVHTSWIQGYAISAQLRLYGNQAASYCDTILSLLEDLPDISLEDDQKSINQQIEEIKCQSCALITKADCIDDSIELMDTMEEIKNLQETVAGVKKCLTELDDNFDSLQENLKTSLSKIDEKHKIPLHDAVMGKGNLLAKSIKAGQKTITHYSEHVHDIHKTDLHSHLQIPVIKTGIELEKTKKA